MAGPLAQMIRQKFPGAYQGMDDATLEKAILAKYPQYAKLVEVKPQVPAGTAGSPIPQWEPDPIAEAAKEQVPKPEPNPLAGGIGSILQGLKESTVPWERASDIIEGPKQVLKDPVGSAKLVLEAVNDSAKAQNQKADQIWNEASQQPWKDNILNKALTYVQAAGHRVAGAIPLIGPAAANAAERLAGDEPLRGLGNVAGMLLPAVAAGKVESLKPSAPSLPGVPLLRSERTGNPVMRFVENMTERTIPGSTRFQKFRERQQSALIDEAAQNVVDSVSSFKGTPEELGLRVETELNAAKKALLGKAGALYDEIDQATATTTKRVPKVTQEASKAGLVDAAGNPVMVDKRTLVPTQVGGVQVPTRSLKKVAIPILRRLQQESNLIPPGELSRASEMLTRLVEAPDQLPFKVFQDARSDLLQLARTNTPIAGKFKGLAKKLAIETDDAMIGAARESGVPGLENKVREANAAWRDAVERFNETVIKKALTNAPEKAHLLLKSASIEDLGKLRQTLPAQTWQDLKATLLRDMLNEAIQGEDLPGIAGSQHVPGVSTTNIRKLRGNVLRTQFEKLDPRIGAVFEPQELNEIRALANTAEQIGRRGTGQAVGLLAGGVNMGLLYGTLRGVMTGDMATLGQTAAGAAGLYALSRVLTRPQGASMFRKVLVAVGKNDPKAIQFWSQRLSQVLNDQGEDLVTPSRLQAPQ